MYPYDMAMRRAEALLDIGNSAAAIDALRDALTAEPDDPYPHLLLARALRQQGRIEGALYEADQAIALSPMWSAAHLERSQTLMLKQRQRQALQSADHAIELAPDSAAAHLVRAGILRVTGRRRESQDSLRIAQQLAPTSPEVIAEFGYSALEDGRTADVAAAGREILSLNPNHDAGLVLTGHAQLMSGNTDEAVQLALAALAQAPTDINALSLLASAKMKGNLIGGLWWRWNSLMIRLGQTRAIFVAVAVWVIHRWAILGSQDLGMPDEVGSIIAILYLAFVICILSAGTIVNRMVAKEMAQVRLKPRF
ncbi:tetratricopeptide repeat protein [Altererythrobacter xixiisoli]|uniref:Tetratricopeptide repeat protein n=1 Tax=Croceibacterium xixiisoli TaxID=1476466 RepID=A0A6I4TVF1_9SPHN|nr:tetratricopeptide repeat protein [Croceibacterium xixiisoli]MXO98293.1 tetratricopeptide repeat protein [Croceibacterium xixiisoli]